MPSSCPRRSGCSRLRNRGVPKILYAKGLRAFLPSVAVTGADVVSVDWRTDLEEARRSLGRIVALQGNVDPRILLTSPEIVAKAAQAAVEKTGGLGHILNLGHGILPTDSGGECESLRRSGQSGASAGAAGVAERARVKATHSQMQRSKSQFAISRSASSPTPCSKNTIVPVPRYTSYPTAPVWKDDFGPDDLESYYARAEAAGDAAFALHAHSLLREPLPVLRVHRLHSKGQESRNPLPGAAEARN